MLPNLGETFMERQVLRKNSVLKSTLGSEGSEFLQFALGAIERLLPHVEVTKWEEASFDGETSSSAQSVVKV